MFRHRTVKTFLSWLNRKKRQKSYGSQGNAPFTISCLAVTTFSSLFPIFVRFKLVIIWHSGDRDEARVSQWLPKERWTFSAKHDHFCEIISQTILTTKMLIKLFPVSVFAKAGPISKHKLHLWMMENGKANSWIKIYCWPICLIFSNETTIN